MSNPTPITVNENKASSKYIDRNPPLATDPDLNRKVVDYLAYLKEILNFSVATTGKRITDTSGYVNELVRTSNSLISTIYDTQNGLVTQISQQAGEITLMADKLDHIGGRNLIINTFDTASLPQDAGGYIVLDSCPRLVEQPHNSLNNYWLCTPATHGVKMNRTNNASTSILNYSFGTQPSTPSGYGMQGLKAGDTYTFSADMNWRLLTSATTTPAYVTVRLAWFDSNAVRTRVYAWEHLITPATEQNAHAVATFTIPNEAVAIIIQIIVAFEGGTTAPQASEYPVGDWLKMENMKLEHGSVATAWTPAPEDQVGNNEIISKINIAPGTIKIQANKVDLEGYVTFTNLSTAGDTSINGGNIQTNTLTLTSFDSTAQAALITGTTVKNQYYLSTSSSSATGGSWSDTVPAWSSGKYVWTRVRTTKTFANGNSSSSDSTAVYDANMTSALSTAAAASTAASNAATAAGTAQTTADGALASTVSCYYRSTSSTTPTISTSTSIGTAADTSDAWEYVLPRPKNGCYFFTCEKYTTKGGTVSFSTVRQIANATYTSLWCSSSDATYIDGGQIYTGSITADRIKANETFTQKLYAQDFNITGGSISISTSATTYDFITLNITDSYSNSDTQIRFDTYGYHCTMSYQGSNPRTYDVSTYPTKTVYQYYSPNPGPVYNCEVSAQKIQFFNTGAGTFNSTLHESALVFKNSSNVVTETYSAAGLQTLKGGYDSIARTDSLIACPEIPSADITGSTEKAYAESLIKWICANYSSKDRCNFTGTFLAGGNRRMFMLMLSSINPDSSGLPTYATGFEVNMGTGALMTINCLSRAVTVRNTTWTTV